MEFPFDTTTKDGHKATVMGMMPDGRLIGFVAGSGGRFTEWTWSADGSCRDKNMNITFPLPLPSDTME